MIPHLKPAIVMQLAILLSFSNLFAQYKNVDSCAVFTLHINAKNNLTDTVRLLYYDCEKAFDHKDKDKDMVVLSKGRTTVWGKVNRATEAIFFVDSKNRLFDGPGVIRFIIEPGAMSLDFTAEGGQAKDVVIKGSSSQKQKERWEQDNASILAAGDDILYNQLPAIDKAKGTKDSVGRKKKSVAYR